MCNNKLNIFKIEINKTIVWKKMRKNGKIILKFVKGV